ncbi:MAG TPA: WhiB family transcriptional regulator [Microthrixaceae bacterium]|nr:WhiB family transcriptional regulator [Microthrixaceae bacterium]
MSAQPSLDTWQNRGACRGPQSAVFFPPPQFERKVDRIERERRAKAICHDCAVRQECLGYAVAIREPHGIWGGLNEAERRELYDDMDLRSVPPRE